MYPTASVIIGCTAKSREATTAATSGRTGDATAEVRRQSLAARHASIATSATLIMWSNRLVRWNPKGAGPQTARSMA